ncbi:uncharacterized protein JCM6883_001557 [Sporobolomyces salmoneus]|uniref:uncharacterized protein n=1 Tax=Sporobolomyces salmoneus TaxID=183962 RepID=UPI003175D389
MDPRLIPPGTLPPPNGAAPVQVQQRPNISYFLFLSLMFYLLNYNNSASSPLTFTSPSSTSSNSTESPYAVARYRLLLREARYEGLSRWLGASNQSSIDENGWLNSTYFPSASSNSTTALKVTPFDPQRVEEPKIVTQELLRGIMDRSSTMDSGRVYPQNLTGFVQGGWQSRLYTFEQLGLNETWQTETRRRNTSDSTPEQAPTTETNSTNLLESRQIANHSSLAPINSTSSLNSTAPLNSTFEIITTTWNRTELRGSFPFQHQTRRYPNKALFNLREVQTSATGPVIALPENGAELDDSQLLKLRETGDWEEWEKKGPVTYLGGDLTISVEEGEFQGEQTSLDIEAAHLLSSGLLYGYATPSFVRSHVVETVSLPFYANSSDSTLSQYREANLTAQAIGRSMLKETQRRLKNDFDRLNETLAEQERNEAGGGGGGDDSDSFDSTIPQCIFRFYGALDPLPSRYTPSIYSEFYASLFRPTGSSLPPPPTQTLRYVLSSTNCGIVLGGSGTFLPTPLLWTRTKDFALLIGFGQLVIVILLVRHLERTATRPGTIVNVASASIGIGCIVDAYSFVLLLTAGVVTSTTRSSLPLFIPSFLALLSSLLFGMRYVSMIRAATPLPNRTPTRNVAAAQVPPPATPTTNREELAARAAERRARGEDTEEEEDAEVAAPVTVARDEGNNWNLVPTSERINLGLMLLGLFASIAIVFRWGWIAWLMLIVYSYWIPQIILNVQRGTARQSLSTEFIVGTTFARLVLPVYFYGYSENVLDVDASPWIYALIFYSSLQALVLVLQSRPRLGPRFFLSQRILDFLELPQFQSWDYHQPLYSSKLLDIEVSLREEGNSDEAGPTCSICMDTVPIKPTKQELDLLGPVAGDRVRSNYAVTPCEHLFHTQCLQEWMNVRAQCPECRKSLPSLS